MRFSFSFYSLVLLFSVGCIYDLDQTKRPDAGAHDLTVDSRVDSDTPPIDGGRILVHGDLGLGILGAACVNLPGNLEVSSVVHESQPKDTDTPDGDVGQLNGPTGLTYGTRPKISEFG